MRIDWYMAGFQALRYHRGVAAECERHGQRVLDRANSTLKNGHKGYRMISRRGVPRPRGRWRVSVAAVTPYAKRSNAIHNTLVKALSQ